MKYIEYKEKSMRTANKLTAVRDYLHGKMGLLTEVAELVDPLKAYIAYNKPINWNELKKELGDIMWFFTLLYTSCKIPQEVEEVVNGYIEEIENPSKDSICFELDGKTFDNLNDISLDQKIEVFLMVLDKTFDLGEINSPLYIVSLFQCMFYDQIFSEGYEKDIFQLNIDKLQLRYPDKFDYDLAVNRDLKVEDSLK